MTTAAVIGQGVLGSCIAVELALSAPGVRVFAFDAHKSAEECRLAAERLAAPHGERALRLVREITFAKTLAEAVASAALVCEAIPETLAWKQALFEDIERASPASAVLTTNTLTLRLEEVSARMRQPSRLVGLRFLYPVLFIPFVELTTASSVKGNRETAAALRDLMQDVLHKIVFTFDVAAALEGESEADFLARARGFTTEALETRRARMESAGMLRYRMDPETARRHAEREKRLRWGGTTAQPGGTSAEPWCVVCLDAPPQVVLLGCGHVVLCEACARQLMLTSRSCPVCRRAVPWTDAVQRLWT